VIVRAVLSEQLSYHPEVLAMAKERSVLVAKGLQRLQVKEQAVAFPYWDEDARRGEGGEGSHWDVEGIESHLGISIVYNIKTAGCCCWL
jgi:hypothetical protein